MPKLPIADIEVGMILAKDVEDTKGRPLLKANNKINEKHIAIFKSLDIAEIEVKGEDETTSLEDILAEHPELANETEQTAQKLFQHANVNAAMYQELIPLWKERFIRKNLKKRN